MKREWDLQLPPARHPEVATLLAAIKDSTREWLEYFEEFEPSIEVMCWRARPDGPSPGALLLHMADCDAYWFQKVIGGIEGPALHDEFFIDFNLVDEGKWPEPPAQPLAWYLDRLERTRQRVWEYVLDRAPDEWVETERSRFTIRWIIAHVLQHDAYHGGQMVTLFELYRAQALMNSDR